MTGVFEPASLHDLIGISSWSNLLSLTYRKIPTGLVQVRKRFEDDGVREQGRQITYVLKRREAEICCERCYSKRPLANKGRPILWSADSTVANCGAFVLNKVFFDWTCQYGMNPGRAMSLGILLWFFCSLLYFICVHTNGAAGLYRVYSKNIQDDPQAQRRVEKISPRRTKKARGLRWLFQFLRRECLLLRTAMFFSLMSAFNIGFRDINFGRWLRLLTRQEFDIKAVGWARVVAGWQSLISVCLIALWVLTYFGHPFDY